MPSTMNGVLFKGSGYADADGDALLAYQVQLSELSSESDPNWDDPTFLHWDTGKVYIAPGDTEFSTPYGGEALDAGTYYWRARWWDARQGLSAWAYSCITLTEDFTPDPGYVDTIQVDPIVPWRIRIMAMGAKRGPGTTVAVLEDAANVGASIMYNSPGELHFTLPVDHPQISVIEPKQTHYAVEFHQDDGWREVFNGVIWDYDATETEVIFYGIDYLALFQYGMEEAFDINNPTKTIAAGGSYFANQTIHDIAVKVLQDNINATDSVTGFICVGPIANMVEKVSIPATLEPTLQFVTGLIGSHRQGQGKKTRVEVVRGACCATPSPYTTTGGHSDYVICPYTEDSVSITLNGTPLTPGSDFLEADPAVGFIEILASTGEEDVIVITFTAAAASESGWIVRIVDDPGVTRENLRLSYGELVQGYRVIPFGVDWASRLPVIGRSREGTKIWYKAGSGADSPAIDQSVFGRVTRAQIIDGVVDENDILRRQKQLAIHTGKLGRQIGLAIRIGILQPLDGYNVCDTFPVQIKHGAVDTQRYGSGYWDCLGLAWEAIATDATNVILTLVPRDDRSEPDEDLIPSRRLSPQPEWQVPLGDAGTDITIDPADGSNQLLTLDQPTAAVTLAPTVSATATVTLALTNTSGTSTVDWSANDITWLSGSPPTLGSNGAGSLDQVTLRTYDNGTTWHEMGGSGGPSTAADISIVDTGDFFSASDVEAALQELAKKDLGYQAHGSMGSSETFDALTGWHSGTVNASCTITLTGATSGLVASMVLELAVDSGGPYTETWPGSVVWSGGSAPTLEASTTYLVLLMSRNGGTTWFAFLAGGGPDLSGIDFLVGTASGDLTSEIVVGTTPGGELGGTWASPTVDTVHSGSAHGPSHIHVAYETHTADGSTTTFTLDQVYDPGSVMAWNRTTGHVLGVTEVAPDQATISAAGTAADLIDFHYAASII